jgi:hypothetical protein
MDKEYWRVTWILINLKEQSNNICLYEKLISILQKPHCDNYNAVGMFQRSFYNCSQNVKKSICKPQFVGHSFCVNCSFKWTTSCPVSEFLDATKLYSQQNNHIFSGGQL